LWIGHYVFVVHALRNSAVHVRRLNLLGIRDFRLLLSSQFASQVADALTTFTLAQTIMFSNSGGPSLKAMAIGFLVAALPLLLVGPIAGWLSDRIRRSYLLWSGHLLRAAVTLLLVPMLLWDWWWTGYLVFGVLAALSRILYTARATALPKLVRRHELVAAGSTSLIAGVIAGTVGAGLGGLLSPSVPLIACVLAAIGHLVAATGYGRIGSDLGGAEAQKRVSFLSIRHDITSAKTRFAMLSTMTHRLILGIALAGIALYIDNSWELQTTGYVAVLGAAAIGSFTGSLSSEWVSERLTKKWITLTAFTTSTTAMALASVVDQPIVRLGAVTATALGFQVLRIRADATIHANTPSAKVGHVFAAYDILYNAFFIIGGVVGMVLALQITIDRILVGVSIAYGLGAAMLAIVPEGKGQEGRDLILSSTSADRIESRALTTHDALPSIAAQTSSTIRTKASVEANRSSWVPMDSDVGSRQEVNASPSPVRIVAAVPDTTSD
jgi:MFS family permease